MTEPYTPADKELADRMRDIGAILNAIFTVDKVGMGYALLTFGPAGLHYLSNCDRDEVISAMKVMIDRWEKGESDPLVGTRLQ